MLLDSPILFCRYLICNIWHLFLCLCLPLQPENHRHICSAGPADPQPFTFTQSLFWKHWPMWTGHHSQQCEQSVGCHWLGDAQVRWVVGMQDILVHCLHLPSVPDWEYNCQLVHWLLFWCVLHLHLEAHTHHCFHCPAPSHPTHLHSHTHFLHTQVYCLPLFCPKTPLPTSRHCLWLDGHRPWKHHHFCSHGQSRGDIL